MPITKIAAPSGSAPINPNEQEVEIPELPPEMNQMTELEDGSYVFSQSEDGPEVPETFDQNLADLIEIDELMAIGNDLVDKYEVDRRSRKQWEETYKDGLDLLGLKVEARTSPWAGASGVYHPVLAEAAIRFEAQAMLELCPAVGPADVATYGRDDVERNKRALRVKQELNYQTMNKMHEFRAELEQMLFNLGPAGSAFKKVYRDPITNRPCSIFVPAEDFVIAYGASDLMSSPRYCHVIRQHANEIKKLQAVGFYRRVELPTPAPEFREIGNKRDKLQGVQAQVEYDDRHTILEFHVDYDIPGYEMDFSVPYVITVDKQSREVLSVRRNWREDDPLMQKRMHFVHYMYLPGLGFYGTGQIHILGGLAKAATSILRQLIDAGTLSVLPMGYKARGFRVKQNDQPIRPGEFRDSDAPAGVLRDNIFVLPSKDPSPVMAQILTNLVEEARKVGSIAEMDVSGMSQQAPVGTTLALLERNLKVMSGVQARLHASMKKELRLIADIIAESGEDYEYDEQPHNRTEDFLAVGRDIIPVSDPNASMMAQRVVQYQAGMELAYKSPDLYNLPVFHQHMLTVLGIKEADKIVKLPEEAQPTDPVSENMAILNGLPAKAFLPQDHQAHLQVHMAFAQDPNILEKVGQSPAASKIQGAMSAHIAEHLAFAYRAQIEQRLGIQLPPPGEPLPPEVEGQLSKLVAEAAQMVLAENQGAAAQKKAEETVKDPIFQLQKEKNENQRLEVMRKMQKDKADQVMNLLKVIADNDQEIAQLAVEMYKVNQDVDARQAANAANAGMKLVDVIARSADKGKREPQQ
jgi:hypothetical protein